MAIFSPPAISSAAAAAEYDIANSARFDDGSTPYLNLTPSASDRKKWTISCWVKRGNLGSFQYIFSAGSGSLDSSLRFENTDSLKFQHRTAANAGRLITNAKYRDPSAWYHIVVASDTANATAGDRMKMYVNGLEVTSFSTDDNPNQNLEPGWNSANAHRVGASNTPLEYLDGHLAEFYSIDGQALTPSDFGETDGTYGHWKAIEYTGSYGTNGFYLPFEDGTSLGNDESGNNNDFTQTSISVAADQMLDSPTNNFCTLNPLNYNSTYAAIAEGLLHGKGVNTSDAGGIRGTVSVATGKWYWEVLVTLGTANAYPHIGIANADVAVGTNHVNDAAWSPDGSGSIAVSGNQTGITEESGQDGVDFTTGDIIQVALDLENGKLWFGKNNTWINSGSPTGGTNNQLSISGGTAVVPTCFMYTSTAVAAFNFGQDSSFAGGKTAQGNADDNGYGDFYYSPPSGFLALCTDNLTDLSTPYQAYSSCGTEDEALEVTYTGNGNADGPFIYLGFMATEICIDGTNYSPSHADFDFNANGIKLRSATTKNTSSTSYTLEAWIDKDFKYSEAGVE
jgi:hypothetical protein